MGEDDKDRKKKKEKKEKKKRKRSRKTNPDDDDNDDDDILKKETPSKEENNVDKKHDISSDKKRKMVADDDDKEIKKSDIKGEGKKDEKNDDHQDNDDDDDDKVDHNDNNNDDEGDEDADKPKRKRKRKRKKNTAEDGDGTATTTTNPSTAAMNERTRKLQSLEHTVFVEGIPFDVTEDDVKEFFVSQGCEDVLQLRLPQWQDTGRLRGYGHVVFDTIESRQRAIQELNGQHLGKRYLTICIPKESNSHGGAGGSAAPAREQPPGCTVVFVKNLPYHATEDDIQQAMQVCGKILYIRIARNFQSNVSKGFAYVEYKNPEGAYGAVQKAAKPFGLQVLDRPVFCDYDEGRIKGSFKTQDGRLWSKEHSEYGKKKK